MAAQKKGPGGKQPTINDVAALAGVSKKPVSRVLNRSEFLTDKTRAAVEKAIEQLGFVPNPQARALAFRDRKRVEEGKRVSVRVDLGGRRINKNKNKTKDLGLYYSRLDSQLREQIL